jgi:hypothetical protein
MKICKKKLINQENNLLDIVRLFLYSILYGVLAVYVFSSYRDSQFKTMYLFLILIMSSDSNKYRLDRNVFKMVSFEESDNYMRDYISHTWQERLSVSLYLTSLAYQFDADHPPPLDRSYFQMKNRN